jgi:hypothetical protein
VGATCAVRTQTPYIRVIDNSLNTYTEGMIQDNQFIGGSGTGTANMTTIDMVSSASLGNITLSRMAITGNLFELNNSAASKAIDLPTVNPGQITNVSIANNSFLGTNNPSVTSVGGYQGSFGSLSLQNGRMTNGSIPALGVALTQFFFPFDSVAMGAVNAAASVLPPIARTNQVAVMTGAGTVWKMTCQVDVAPGGTSTRIFTLEKAGVATAMTCTITSAVKTCTPAAGAASAPIAYVAGDTIDYTETATVAPVTANGSCVAYVSHDTVM